MVDDRHFKARRASRDRLPDASHSYDAQDRPMYIDA
jgi:hypothetical protein